MRFESPEEAQAYLDRWEERWADTRIHGTTKRQVAAMFAEEKPALFALPVEPFRYYQYGERTVHLDGCVEVEAAYYGAPPGWIGRHVQVQWDASHVRILDPLTGNLLREHLRQQRGRHRIKDEDRSWKTPMSTRQLLARCEKAGQHIGAFCQGLHRNHGEVAVRRILGVLSMAIDLISCLVSDELTRRSDRLLDRRRKQAGFRDAHRTLDNFDFTFNPKMNRSLIFDLATGAFIGKREDALFLGPGGTGKSHLAQAIGQAAIQQGYRVLYRETHVLLDELADAVADGTRKDYMESVATVPLLIIDDFGMRKLPHTAAEDLLEIVMRRYERASTLLTSNRPVEDWGKLLGDVAAVSAVPTTGRE